MRTFKSLSDYPIPDSEVIRAIRGNMLEGKSYKELFPLGGLMSAFAAIMYGVAVTHTALGISSKALKKAGMLK